MRQKSAMLGVAAAAAVSGASFSAFAGACTTANVTTYLAGGANAGCTVLDKTFSGFSVNLQSTDEVFKSATVHPVTTANNPGLNFQFNELFSSQLSPLTSTISFTVTAPSSAPMTDASLSITGALAETTAAAVSVSEMLSNGKSLSAVVPSGSPPFMDVTVSSNPTTFAATTSLTVTDTISLTASFFDQLTNQFSETPVTAPEPSSLALLGVGLSAFGFARRRKRS